MSQGTLTEVFDESVEPEVGQVYAIESREQFYQILYVDDRVVLLRGDDNYSRIERRTSFEAEVEAGHFTHKPESDLDMQGPTDEDWATVSYIGEKTSQNLHDAGFKTKLDIHQASDDELLDVGGLGAGGLSNLREYVR